MANAPTFQKATRSAVKLKIGMQGPSGSGKTLGALAVAAELAGKDRFAVIDTENGSASLYADRFDFDTLNLGAPYTSLAYVEAIKAAVAAGYKVLIIDSLSHQWVGKGGILSRKEDMDKRGGNSFTNWAEFTKEHEAFKAYLLAADVHIICTLRTKQEYIMEENSKGKQMPKKVGTAAVQREGMEYELSVVFELQMDHKATTSKDRTGLFDGQLIDLTDSSVASTMREWLASAGTGAVAAMQSLDQGAGPDQASGERTAAHSADTHLDAVPCPECGGRMWNNKLTKRNPGAPDYKCRDRNCDGVVYPPRNREQNPDSAPPVTPALTSPADDGEMTLDEAKLMTVSDNPAGFGGKGADLLDSYSTEHLQQLRTWFEDKVKEKHRADQALRIEAATLILDAREAEQGKLELAAITAPSEPVADLLPEPTAEVKQRVHGKAAAKRGTGMEPDQYVPAPEMAPDDLDQIPF